MIPEISQTCRLTDVKTVRQTGQLDRQTGRSCVTMVTTVAAGYLLFAPDDEVPLLPVFL